MTQSSAGHDTPVGVVGRVLIVEDEPSTAQQTEKLVSRTLPNWIVDWAKALPDALEYLNTNQYSILVTDVRLEETDVTNHDGLEVVAHAASLSPPPIIIAMSHYYDQRTDDDVRVSIAAIKRGAMVFIPRGLPFVDWPFLLEEWLHAAVDALEEQARNSS